MACLRDFTLGPCLLPEWRVPCFFSCMTCSMIPFFDFAVIGNAASLNDKKPNGHEMAVRLHVLKPPLKSMNESTYSPNPEL